MRDLSGQTLGGRWLLVKKVGDGGSAVVYEAQHTVKGGRAAVKVLTVHGRDPTEEEVERFRREAQSLEKIDHPNLVKVHDAGTDEHLWIAMEYLDGPLLNDYIAGAPGGKLAPAEVARLLEPICDALDAAHERGIVHRDVKPQNIKLVRGSPVLFDFGIAAVEDSTLTQNFGGGILGTPAYMAPEVWEREADARSDVYALGLITYECLTGRLPFAAKSALEWKEKHRTETPAVLNRIDPTVPSSLSWVVMRAIGKHPGERWQSAGEFSEAFSAALAGRRVKPLIPARVQRPLLFLGGLVVAAGGIIALDPDADDDDDVPAASEITVVSSTPALTATAIATAANSSAATPLAPVVEKWGTFSIDSRPWGELYVDGKKYGKQTPAFEQRIRAGRRVIRVHNPEENLEATVTIEIREGELSKLGTLTLERRP